MLNRCPGCGKEVKEEDDICPHCKRDFSAPVARKKPSEPAKEPPPKTPEGKKAGPPAAKAPDQTAKKAPPQAAKPPPAGKPPPKKYAPVRQPLGDDEPRLAPSAALELEGGAGEPIQSVRGSEPITQIAPPPPSSSWILYVVIAVFCGGGFWLMKDKLGTEPPPAPTPKPKPVAKVVKPEPKPEPKPKKKPEKPAEVVPDEQAPPPVEPTAKGKRKRGKKRRKKKRAPVAEPVMETAAFPSAAPEPPARRTTGDKSEFRVRGKVFALLSLEPVGEADVVFTNLSTGRRYETQTGDDGSYRAHLPVSDQGYSLAIRHSDYEPSYIPDEGFRDKSESERSRIAGTRSRSMSTANQVQSEGGVILEQDYALVPAMR